MVEVVVEEEEQKRTTKIPVDTTSPSPPPNPRGSNPAPPSHGECPIAEFLPSSNCIHCLGPSSITSYLREWIKGHHRTRTGLLQRW